MDSKKIDLFENYSIPKAVAALSIPSLIGCIVMILYNIADTYFVGLLGDPVESSAVTLAAPVLLAFNAINNIFGVGGSSMMSRSLGKREYETVKRTAAFSFYMSLICGLLISVFYIIFDNPFLKLIGADSTSFDATSRYLHWTVAFGAIPAILNVVVSNLIRAEGEAVHASVGVMSGCILNIVLDPFFVLPEFLGMGAAGAGCATFVSNCFALLYLLVVIFIKRKTTYVCINPLKFCWCKDIAKEVFGVGVPSGIQNLLNVTGQTVLNNITSAFGPAAVSAMGISHKIFLLPLYLSMGITQGIMPLISYNYASKNRERMKHAIYYVANLGVVITLIITALYLIFAENIVRAFMDVDEVVDYGKILLREMSLGVPFLALDYMVLAVFQATGKGIYSLLFAILRKIVLEIPAIILFNKIWPLYGMGFSQPFAEVILAVVAVIMLKKIVNEKVDVTEKSESTASD